MPDVLYDDMLRCIAFNKRKALRMAKDKPNLGLATTRELLAELSARIEIHATGGLDYRTVDGQPGDMIPPTVRHEREF